MTSALRAAWRGSAASVARRCGGLVSALSRTHRPAASIRVSNCRLPVLAPGPRHLPHGPPAQDPLTRKRSRKGHAARGPHTGTPCRVSACTGTGRGPYRDGRRRPTSWGQAHGRKAARSRTTSTGPRPGTTHARVTRVGAHSRSTHATAVCLAASAAEVRPGQPVAVLASPTASLTARRPPPHHALLRHGALLPGRAEAKDGGDRLDLVQATRARWASPEAVS